MILCGGTATAARAFVRDIERTGRAVEARLAEARAQIAHIEAEERAEVRLQAMLRTTSGVRP
jgi:hypothetical protein